jgi:adenosylcobyric acid synthase
VPVAGVIPYFHDIQIAEEDSITLEKRRSMKHRTDFDLDIAVIALPHIANFDDFDPLAREPRVRLRYVEVGDDLGEPDLIILPGTKSTVADLSYLRTTGQDREIKRRVSQGVPIIGICGGYQMLGSTIRDPDHIESAETITTGLALLPVISRFMPVKSTHQIRARVAENRGILAGSEGTEILGYEIHMGQTGGADIAHPFELIERSSQPCSSSDGCLSADGNVMGTYIHGLFHNDRLRHAILTDLAARKGRAFSPPTSGLAPGEHYDRLAAQVRNSLNMDLIQRFVDRR